MAPPKDPSASNLSENARSQELQSVAPPPEAIVKSDVATVRGKTLSFTQSQLALAVTIQRSLPADITTREYCLGLAKNVKLVARPDPRERRHVDSAEFWKEQCNQLHSQKINLEMEVCRLEQLALRLRNKNEHQLRSVAEQIVTESNKSFKRKAPHSLEFTVDELQDGHSLDQPIPSGEVTYLPLLMHAQVLYRLVQDNQVSPDTLLASQKSAISSMAQVLADVSRKCSKRGQSDQKSCVRVARQAFDVVRAVFNICLQSLGHLCRDITGRLCKGQVIHALVKFFAGILEEIQSLCLGSEEQETDLTRATRLRFRVRQEARSQTRIQRSPLLMPFTHLVKNILLCPELLTTYSAPVLEGVLGVLLSRIGNLMSESVFGTQISSSSLPGGIANAEEPKRSSEQEMAVQLEGQHLAWTLEQAISNRDVKERNALLALLTGRKTSLRNSGNEVFLAKARQRLRDTLLTGVFGVSGQDFLTALKLPEDSGEEWSAGPANLEPVVFPSFIESIWSTVGWQILQKEEK